MSVEIWGFGWGAFVIHTPDDGWYVYDTAVYRGKSPGFTGLQHNHLVPYLYRHFGVRKIDGIIVSHFNFDHGNGAPALIRQYRGASTLYTAGVYSTQLTHDVEVGDAIDAACADTGTAHVHVQNGDNIGGWFDVLNPLPEHFVEHDELTFNGGRWETSAANNEVNLTVRLVHGDFSYLFTGDVGPSELHATRPLLGLKALIAQDKLPPCTAMQIPHHGDNRYIDDDIMDAVNPEWVEIGFVSSAIEDATKAEMDARSITWHQGTPWYLRGESDGTWFFSDDEAYAPGIVPWPRASL